MGCCSGKITPSEGAEPTHPASSTSTVAEVTPDFKPKLSASGGTQGASEKSPRSSPIASTPNKILHGENAGHGGNNRGHSHRGDWGAKTPRSSRQRHGEDASRRSLTHVDLLMRERTPRTNQPDLLARVYLSPPASLPPVRDHPACLFVRQMSYLQARGVGRDPDASWGESCGHGDFPELMGDPGRSKRSRKRSKFEVMTGIYLNPQPRQCVSSLSKGKHSQAD